MQKVQNLIIGRLIVIFLLLITGWVWYSRSLNLTLSDIPRGPFLIFAISVGMTAVYFLFLRLSTNLNWQVRAQFLTDIFLITWLIWQTGDLTSPYITLYIVVIGVSSIFLNPAQTLMMAFVSIALFSLMGVLIAFDIINGTGDSVSTVRMIQVVSFHIVAFLVVGLLAARLSDRRTSGEQLVEATRSLADLRALHERIVESIRSGLITTDLAGKIYTFNTAAAEITGYSAAEIHGWPIQDLIPNIDEALQLTSEAQARGEQSPRFECDLMTPEGFTVRIGYSVTNLFSEEQEKSGLIITFQDLTEIRSMEESVRRKDRLAAVGRVGAGLAHEIRNPLGAMRGAIQVLESNTPKDSVQADLMGIIMRESDRLNSIITNFLNYAKPKSGNFSEVDVCEVIRDTTTLLRHSPELKDSHIIVEHLPDAPVTVLADSSQLKQVIWNLARNSISAMPDGGKLTVRVEQAANRRVRIAIEDTGIGMTPEQVEQLFEPFTNSTSGGTGLGLSIVYQIIKDHSGTVNVRSSEGEGTTITIELPREQTSVERPRHNIQKTNTDQGSPLSEFLNVKNE
ncbi:two-component system sensor histidine kinase NtrB [Leptolyngbya sp. 7M]|uniref:two-component system sensor histidine kinase NtrB n=1 Tax=Leptolyngbya sp. 7M TaxID=2812896 RepID=UPI001B8B42D6|nr:ATP-binding protein [Leptolyngbya sp. 7M]QYO66208.1 PAS domain S-box protein [Leptolyngbya sp. 7M]